MEQSHNRISFTKACLINIRSHFITKDANIWVFGAVRGEKYMDNAKYLFEYVNTHTDITAIWLSNNNKAIKQIKDKGFIALHMHSQEAMKYALRAKIAIITHRGSREKSDLPFYAFTKKTKIIQLWHGMPLKKIAFDDKLYSFTHDESKLRYKIREAIKKIFFPFTQYVNQPSLIIALSEETRAILSRAFRVDKKKIVITGFPRNTPLLKQPENVNGTKKILYAPTFRDAEGSKFDLFDQYGFNAKQMDDFLVSHNAELHIKLHPFNMPLQSTLKEIESSKNITFLHKDDIYDELNIYSVLITDYSSIYFDFLLTGKPIIFSPFDKVQYLKNDRELYFDYGDVTPGPQAENWEMVILFISDFLTKVDSYQNMRNVTKERFHYISSDNYSKTVYREIKKCWGSK